jgi:hypothetical protein
MFVRVNYSHSCRAILNIDLAKLINAKGLNRQKSIFKIVQAPGRGFARGNPSLNKSLIAGIFDFI